MKLRITQVATGGQVDRTFGPGVVPFEAQSSGELTREVGRQLTEITAQIDLAPVQASILIPAYNEEQALPHVLEAIFAVVDTSYEVLVIDDGSRDGTRAVAERFPCAVISHETNHGKGAAMRTGVQFARGQKLIFIDADATYPADAIPDIVRHLDRADLVRCVRSEGRDNIPFLNRIGNQLFDTVIKRIHRVAGDDMLSGLYGIRKEHLQAMRLDSRGFDIESEIMIKAQAMGLHSSSIPISYNERIGEKKLKPIRDGAVILMRVLGLALHHNPFATYIVPGLVLWSLALIGALALSVGPILTPFTGFHTHTLIVSVMSFLAGFQLVVFGCVVNLYATETGIGRPSRALHMFAVRFPRLGGAFLGILLVIGGLTQGANLTLTWIGKGFGAFTQTEALVIALSLVVWGVQLLSAMLFLSLFAGSARFAEVQQPAPVMK